tara:strand:+ start:202 stop:441 length:240 start_codon:yes stop_codon:yes gene_type:complete
MFSQAQLSEAFDRVQDPSDWRNAIDAFVTVDWLKVTEEAIIHFTGTVPTVTRIPGADNQLYMTRYRLQSVGYRMGPCGP